MHSVIHWTYMNRPEWRIPLAATPQGLCYAGADGESFEDLADWIRNAYPEAALERSDAVMEPYVRELHEYFDGVRQTFTVPLDVKGTAFQLAVWKAIADIPYGETVSYSDVALAIGKPKAVRAVGGALGSNPVVIIIPCHRIIGKQGQLVGYTGGLDMKMRLLELERSHKTSSAVPSTNSSNFL